jgi:hypothetical protein
MKLSQVVALVKDRKEFAKNTLTEAYKAAQKRDTFDGLVRTFNPIVEGEPVPPLESKRASNSVNDLLRKIQSPLKIAFDTVLTQDSGNMVANADLQLTLGSKTLDLKSVPATHLLFLEKQLSDLLTFVNALPTLDPNLDWVEDKATGSYRSLPSKTVRTRKVQKSLVLLAPTKEHPGQAQMITEDVPVIEVETTVNSGAVPERRKQQWVDRITSLREAVIKAREEANSRSIEQRNEGEQILDFIFAD